MTTSLLSHTQKAQETLEFGPSVLAAVSSQKIPLSAVLLRPSVSKWTSAFPAWLHISGLGNDSAQLPDLPFQYYKLPTLFEQLFSANRQTAPISLREAGFLLHLPAGN